jgi:hypothetical protein
MNMPRSGNSVSIFLTSLELMNQMLQGNEIAPNLFSLSGKLFQPVSAIAFPRRLM